jgi:hypothetical protein
VMPLSMNEVYLIIYELTSADLIVINKSLI